MQMQYFTNEMVQKKFASFYLAFAENVNNWQIREKCSNFFQNPHLKNIDKRLKNMYYVISHDVNKRIYMYLF